MNKFLKNLKLFCRVRKESYDLWKRAYQIMPSDVQQNFKEDVKKFADKERETWN